MLQLCIYVLLFKLEADAFSPSLPGNMYLTSCASVHLHPQSNSGVGNKKGGNARGADSKGSHKLGASKAGGGRKGDQPKKPSGQQRGQALHRHTLGALQPVQQKTHWDYVLTEMKWMATDFMQVVPCASCCMRRYCVPCLVMRCACIFAHIHVSSVEFCSCGSGRPHG